MADHDHDDHGGMGKYIWVFGGLLLLTGLSFGVGSVFAEGGTDPTTKTVGWATMMAISCMKALLVMLFFMHLIWEANWKYVLTIPATVMSLLLVLALVPDIGQRAGKYSEERTRYAAEVSLYGDAHGSAEHDDAEHDDAEHDDAEHDDAAH